VRNITRLKETIGNTKGHVKIFVLAIILIIVAAFIMSSTSFITDDGLSKGEYKLLMERLTGVSKLLTQIGIALFSFSTFIGAISDESITNEVRRGMAIAAGMGILAIVLFTQIIIN